MGSADLSHGFLVPVVVAWLVWNRRESLGAPAAPAWGGLVLLSLGLVQYLVGVVAAEFFLQRTSMIPYLWGWTWALRGRATFATLFFPIAFLVFMVPPPVLVWKAISFPLQLAATRAAEMALTVAGISAVRAGNVIHLPTCSLEVADACSGLRSLVMLLGLGAILAEGSLVPGRAPRSVALRVVFFLSAIPVAVFVNAARVSLAAVTAARVGTFAVEGWLHELSGVGMFLVALLLLISWRSTLGWIEAKRFVSSPSS
jgi:exosortase